MEQPIAIQCGNIYDMSHYAVILKSVLSVRLRVASVFIKRRAEAVTTGWDKKVDNAPLTTMIKKAIARVQVVG